MAEVIRQFTPIVTGTSGGLTVTNTIRPCDDAEVISITISSSAGGAIYQPLVSPFEYIFSTAQGMALVSTSTFAPGFSRIQANVTTSLASSGSLQIFPGNTIFLESPAFFQLTILCTGNDTQGTTIGYVVKKIFV